MKILECDICQGELDIISEEGITKQVRCRDCGFTSGKEKAKRTFNQPEVVIRRNFKKD